MGVIEKTPPPMSAPEDDLASDPALTLGSTQLSCSLPAHVGSVLKSLGHPDRLRIIQYLSQGEQCVTDIRNLVGLRQPITSQQLRIMADRHIVAQRRESNVVYYRVANEFIWELLKCMHTLSAKISSGEWSLKQIGASGERESHD